MQKFVVEVYSDLASYICVNAAIELFLTEKNYADKCKIRRMLNEESQPCLKLICYNMHNAYIEDMVMELSKLKWRLEVLNHLGFYNVNN